MIKFLGPRSKTDKSVGMYVSAPGHGTPAATTQAAPTGNAKPLSAPASVEYADVIADRWERLPINETQIDAFNQGGFEIADDWKKIKM